jgi:hypothetical protein
MYTGISNFNVVTVSYWAEGEGGVIGKRGEPEYPIVKITDI